MYVSSHQGKGLVLLENEKDIVTYSTNNWNGTLFV
jgi:hypothetical protein